MPDKDSLTLIGPPNITRKLQEEHSLASGCTNSTTGLSASSASQVSQSASSQATPLAPPAPGMDDNNLPDKVQDPLNAGLAAMVLDPADPPPDDVLLALQSKTNAALQESARKQRLAILHSANKRLGNDYVYSYFRDKLFPIPSSARLFSQHPYWDQSPSFSRLTPRTDVSQLDPKAIRSVLPRTLPTPYYDRFKKNWMLGTLEEYSAILHDILVGVTLCNTAALQALRNCFISLAKTPPDTFSGADDDYRVEFGDLPASCEAIVWCAANRILGCHWTLNELKIKPTRPPVYLSKPKSKQSVPLKVGFAVTTENNAGVFIHHTNKRSRGPPESPLSRATKLARRKHATFFTLGLPQLGDGSTPAASEALSLLHDAFTILWSSDPRLALYTFPKPTPSRTKPYTSLPSKEDPSFNRNHLETFTPQLWLRKGRRAWIRFYIGHDVSVSSLLSTAELKLDSRDITFTMDTIQAPSTVICGFLVGTHRSFDLQHYSALLNSVPSLANHPVALSTKSLKLYYQETVPKGREVYAVHVLCDASKRTATNLLLKALYNRKKAKDIAQLPEGKMFKYAPYYANREDLMPGVQRRNLLRKLRIKQQQFQEKHTTAPLKGVLDLDLPLDFGSSGHLSLRQILLSTKCQANCTHPLLLSVDYSSYRAETTVLFHIGNQEEVLRLLSALPVVLSAQYGSKIWTWFSADLKLELSHTAWNPDKQCLEETFTDDDNLLTNIYGNDTLADWEEVDSLNAPEETTTPMSMDLSLLFHETQALCDPYDDNRSLDSMKTGTTNATLVATANPLDAVFPADDTTTVESSITTSEPSESASPEASSQRAGVSDDHG